MSKTAGRPSISATDFYVSVEKFLADAYGPPVLPFDFYRSLFPVGSFERRGHPEDAKPNGIAMIVGEKGRVQTVVVNDELDAIGRLSKCSFAFMSPIGYVGRNRSSENARTIYALTYDLDGITMTSLGNLKVLIDNAEVLGALGTPRPTFIVHSGHGLHLYYQLDEPLPAYPNVQNALKTLKYRLYRNVWSSATSAEDDVQYQGVMQGFRVVGSGTKLGKDYPVTAYRTGGPVSLDYLLSFVPEKKVEWRDMDRSEYRALFEPYDRGAVSREEAAKLWPEWHRRKVLGEGGRQTWHVKRDLYDWWLNRVRTDQSLAVGHRYFCVMALAIFARKCDICEEELVADALSVVDRLDSLKGLNEDDAFTEDDAMRALDAYQDSYATFPRRDLEKLTGLDMTPSVRRNGRRQTDHLEEARAIRDIRQGRKGANWWDTGNRSGAPTKRDAILAYAAEHPEANHSAIANALGVSRTTVIKWLRIDRAD